MLSDDPHLNCRMEGGRDPVRIVCDSGLRIPLDAQLCRTAKTQPTIVACARENTEKRAALEKLGVTVLHLPGADGRVDLRALMAVLGGQEIDSVLIEGGAAVHWAALESGIVQRLHVYVGAKVFGGAAAPGPVGGAGVAAVADAFSLGAPQVEVFGRDVLLTYDLEKER